MEMEQRAKELETTQKELSDLGWEIVEEEGKKTAQDNATRKTKTQMLREESIR